MPVTINPGLKSNIGLIKQGEYTIDCFDENHKLNITASEGTTTDRIKVVIEFEMSKSAIIKNAVTKTDEEWAKEKDKTCYWDFKTGTNSIEVISVPTLKFIPTINPNDTILDVTFGFAVSKGKIGGGAGTKVGGGAGELKPDFWI